MYDYPTSKKFGGFIDLTIAQRLNSYDFIFTTIPIKKSLASEVLTRDFNYVIKI